MARTGTAFGGRAGAMLARTTSPLTIFTGLVFLAAVWGVVALAEFAPHELVPVFVLHFLMSFFIAHFAMEGYSDQWERGGHPIPKREVAVVALRYLVMTLLLFVPLLIMSPSREDALLQITTPTLDSLLWLLYVLAVIIAPPALIVVSVSADSWKDLLSPSHWRSRFGGRGSDFFLIYVVFIGALFCVLVLGLPLVAVAGLESPKGMQWTAGGLAAFATGFSISLMGRLCGSFAAAPAETPAAKTAPVLHPTLSVIEAAQGNALAAAADGAPRKVALVNAVAKVEELRAKHAGNDAALITALQVIDERFLPHPTVRHALVSALISAGRLQEAVTAARDAIPVCIRSGNVVAAALIYESLLTTEDSLGLAKDQLLSIGDTLKGMRHSLPAVDVYARVLRQDPNEVRAMKSTIAIAQELGQQKDTAAQAVRVYDSLITNCPESRLLDYVRAERAKANKKAEG